MNIQAFRGVLFLFILFFHCGVPYSNFGWAGVESFFVISSFFLVKNNYDNKPSILKQFKHRILRLYPPYLVVIIVAAFAAIARRSIPIDFVSHLLSSQNYHWMITSYSSSMQVMTAHTWTLSIEIWTGLLWLILLKYLNKKVFIRAMYILLFLGVIYRIITILLRLDVYIVSLCPIAHFDAFACGSLLAISVRRGNKNSTKLAVVGAIGVVGILFCILYIQINNNSSFLSAYSLLSSSRNYLNNCITGNIYFFISLLSASIIGMLVYHKEHNSMIYKSLLHLGNKSYVLYLFHWPILVIVRRFAYRWYVLLPAVFILTIVCSWVYENAVFLLKNKIGGIRK